MAVLVAGTAFKPARNPATAGPCRTLRRRLPGPLPPVPLRNRREGAYGSGCGRPGNGRQPSQTWPERRQPDCAGAIRGHRPRHSWDNGCVEPHSLGGYDSATGTRVARGIGCASGTPVWFGDGVTDSRRVLSGRRVQDAGGSRLADLANAARIAPTGYAPSIVSTARKRALPLSMRS